MNPIISVFVPTRNRYEYLKNLVLLIESYHDPRIELVIQDNSDDNSDFLKFLETSSFISTRYYYHKGYLTMSQNSDLAFSKTTGEYVCMIGDDDAVCRNIAESAEWMKFNGIDALRSIDVQFIYPDEGDNLLYYENVKPTYRYFNPENELKKTLKKGLIDFGGMPKPYHGIVRRSIMQKIKDLYLDGSCFPGCTPDMSGAVCASLFVEKYVCVSIPVIIPGSSRAGSGGISAKVATLDDVPWISSNIKDNWEKAIPRIWSRQFIWPESGAKALRYCKREDLLKCLDLNMMRCRYLIMNKQHRRLVIN